jgi:hypothetical protein
MSVYTVYEPPLRGAKAVDPERFVFVRDGFSFWAFVLAPLWMLRHRMWLVFLLYLLLTAVLQAGLWMLDATTATRFLIGMLVSVLVGLEATTLRRWTLLRRGWHALGLVVADDVESAERRFFDAWTTQRRRPMPAMPPAAASLAGPLPAQSPPTVLGLFPEPGAQR